MLSLYCGPQIYHQWLLKPPNELIDQWSTMKCEAVLCVRLKGEGFPVQSCHDQSLKRHRPRPDVFLYHVAYIPPAASTVHLYTSPYKHLLPSCSKNLCPDRNFNPPNSSKERHCYHLPAGPSIIIITTFLMIDFLKTISVQFRAFSIDWHVYKMRMNQKVNQMTNSLFTLIHHPTATIQYISHRAKKLTGLTSWNGQRRCLSIC